MRGFSKMEGVILELINQELREDNKIVERGYFKAREKLRVKQSVGNILLYIDNEVFWLFYGSGSEKAREIFRVV